MKTATLLDKLLPSKRAQYIEELKTVSIFKIITIDDKKKQKIMHAPPKISFLMSFYTQFVDDVMDTPFVFFNQNFVHSLLIKLGVKDEYAIGIIDQFKEAGFFEFNIFAKDLISDKFLRYMASTSIRGVIADRLIKHGGDSLLVEFDEKLLQIVKDSPQEYFSHELAKKIALECNATEEFAEEFAEELTPPMLPLGDKFYLIELTSRAGDFYKMYFGGEGPESEEFDNEEETSSIIETLENIENEDEVC